MIKIYCNAPFLIPIEKDTKLFSNEKTYYKYSKLNTKKTTNSSINRYKNMCIDSDLSIDGFENFSIKIDLHNSANLLLNDSGIAILNCIYTPTEELINFKLLQEESNKYINNIITNIYSDLKSNTTNLSVDTNHFKWVNRTLVCNKNFLLQYDNQIKEQWLSSEEYSIEKLLDNKYYFSWGNNIIDDTIENSKMEIISQSIFLMQYYYTILDDSNEKIKDILLKINNNKKFNKEYKYKLFEMNNTIKNELLNFHDDMINLQGLKKIYCKKIFDIWEFDPVILSIEKKINYCDLYLKQQEISYQKSSVLLTDIILFFIGLTNILSFSLSLGIYFDSFSNLFYTDFFQNTYTGQLLSISSFFSILLITIYIFFKNRI